MEPGVLFVWKYKQSEEWRVESEDEILFSKDLKTISNLHSPLCSRSERKLSTLNERSVALIETQSQTAAPSAPALARLLAPGALSRVGAIALDGKTDPKVVLSAAKLILWASGLSEPPGDEEQGFELRFTPEDAYGD